jgi:hypothetical protein
MKEITVVTPVQDGLVAGVAAVLGRAGINIENLEARDVGQFSVLTLEADRYNEALAALRDRGYDALTEDVVVISVKDEPGSLARVTQRLYEGKIHVRSVRILQRQAGEAMVALSMDRTEDALELIRDLLVGRA